MTGPGRALSATDRWRRTSWGDRALLCEAMLVLGISSLAIFLTPFRFIARAAAWNGPAVIPLPANRRAISRRVRWAVTACAQRAPWRAVCFQRGLAAHWMLRRRSVPSVLYYGTARDPGAGIVAHVWVRDGDFFVIGGDVSSRFVALATFPRV